MAEVLDNASPKVSGLMAKVNACTQVVTKLTAEVRTMRAVAMADGGRWLIEQGVRHKLASVKRSGGRICCAHSF